MTNQNNKTKPSFEFTYSYGTPEEILTGGVEPHFTLDEAIAEKDNNGTIATPKFYGVYQIGDRSKSVPDFTRKDKLRDEVGVNCQKELLSLSKEIEKNGSETSVNPDLICIAYEDLEKPLFNLCFSIDADRIIRPPFSKLETLDFSQKPKLFYGQTELGFWIKEQGDKAIPQLQEWVKEYDQAKKLYGLTRVEEDYRNILRVFTKIREKNIDPLSDEAFNIDLK